MDARCIPDNTENFMKQLKEIIIEKLKINKDSKSVDKYMKNYEDIYMGINEFLLDYKITGDDYDISFEDKKDYVEVIFTFRNTKYIRGKLYINNTKFEDLYDFSINYLKDNELYELTFGNYSDLASKSFVYCIPK